jgi:neutral ceramidase
MMPEKQLLAGAATAVITPTLGVSLCGSMLDRSAANIHDDLHARSLVLDNGDTKVALVVLDLIAARKEWLSEIKHQINSFTGIPLAHILISCTHTHSAPTPVPVFQSNVETEYLKWAAARVADSVRVAVQRLQPARIGWGIGREDRVVFNRRYFMKPGTKLPSPFPSIDEKVKMNPGEMNPAIDRPAGPIDPAVAVLAIQKAENADGQPLALYASYALHYVGVPGSDVSADYFGAVADLLHDLTGGPRRDPRQPFVGMLANGCFGDINNIDVRRKLKQPYPYHQLYAVASIVAQAIYQAWRTIKYRDWVPLAVREKTVELGVRRPSLAEVQHAKEILEKTPQGPLRLLPEIYARETVQLEKWPERFVTIVQAFRIGDLGLCALPGEPFCQTGLDIKAQSPFKPTMLVGMANDYAGYLPTEEQHALGGYETWRAKSSFLEVKAATMIQNTALELLKALAK